MKCNDIIQLIEKIAKPKYAESWDNCGLITGDRDKEIRTVMVALDASNRVVDQAVKLGVDMLITHHPLIFKPVSRVSSDDFIGRKVMKLLNYGICCYAAHTNMDVAVMADEASKKVGLINTRPLDIIYTEKLYKLVVYVPEDSIDKVRNVMCKEGAGFIGNYSDCTFYTPGTGTYVPRMGTNPYIGTQGELTKTAEYRLETIVTGEIMDRVVKSMIKVHPYEEVAYDIYELGNDTVAEGIGRIGYLERYMDVSELVSVIKEKFEINNMRVIGSLSNRVATVAISPGAGKSMVDKAVASNVDVLITGDIDHHTALDAIDRKLCIIDAEHFGTEHFVVDYMKNYLDVALNDSTEKLVNTGIKVDVIKAEEKSPFIYI